MTTAVVLHGHFYQPPREDPWSGRVPKQPTAAPYHDWNERITEESYGPLADLGAFEWLSWDVGPTLLQWLERERPAIYDAVLAGDRAARARTGFGAAIAQPYHHIILPLASRREKRTEVRWGIADFERRFGRAPEGMWLPETAVDRETLEVLAEYDIRFTVLAPHQVVEPPADGGPGRVALDGGREITVFVYDGDLSHGVAFGELLADAERWIARIRGRVAEGATRLVSLATDGETFGHHHLGSEETLAAVLATLRTDAELRIRTFPEVLEAAGAGPALELVEPTSWSCAHGVERWRSDCGCRMAPERPWVQAWRAPLREALEGLATGLDEAWSKHARGVLADPEAARDGLGAVLDAPAGARAAFVRDVAAATDVETLAKARTLLGMARDRAAMFTSCGWFFDDVAGLEPTQVLRYAAHALDGLARLDPEEAARLERSLVRVLAGAPSNDPEVGSAAAIYVGIREAHPLRSAATRPASEDAPDARSDRRPAPPAPARSANAPGERSESPVRFALAVHLHQPVGNFDHVFEDHLAHVYRPFLEAVWERDALPLSLHVSGPLLEWLETHASAFLDEIGRRASDGTVELLASGRTEPILAAWPREDRVEQLESMRDALRERFGVDPTGAWLTERVWEPDLPADLARAGMAYTLLDDRHFLATGLERGSLDRPYRTESGGAGVTILPIDERLRYLIPFRPVDEIEAFFAERHAEGTRLLILGDDGEKFGGWPDTRAWVYDGGWLARFLDALDRLRADGTLRPVTTAAAAAEPSGGLVYPPTGSYRELEEWALPRPAALALQALGDHAGGHDSPDPSPFIRGGHWKGFLTRYPESNRMHKTALALSRLCRERGDPAGVRRAVARAQCNDAYWHGVFGGIYLPHLRRAVWEALAEAERGLRAGEGLAYETLDFDVDGHAEVWVHSSRFSAVLAPARGGAIEILVRLDAGENDADVLSRHLEAYHHDPADPRQPARDSSPEAPPHDGAGTGDGTASIHERERRATPPAVDRLARALFQERVYAGAVDVSELAAGTATPIDDAAARPWTLETVRVDEDAIVVELRATGGVAGLAKRVRLDADGRLRVDLAWDPEDLPAGARVSTELSLAHPRRLDHDDAADAWRYDIVTLGRSERGFEEVRQGESHTILWAAGAGGGWVTLEAPAADRAPGPPETRRAVDPAKCTDSSSVP